MNRFKSIWLGLLCAALAQASSLTTTVGGLGIYNPGGWAEYVVTGHGVINFDLKDPTTVVIGTNIALTELSCAVGPLGLGCVAAPNEYVRIDGELGFNSTHYYFDHSDQYFVAGTSDFSHKEFTSYFCAGVPLPELHPCQVTLDAGHHSVEVYVSTSLGNGFDTHPNPFAEFVAVSVTIADVPEPLTATGAFTGMVALMLRKAGKRLHRPRS